MSELDPEFSGPVQGQWNQEVMQFFEERGLVQSAEDAYVRGLYMDRRIAKRELYFEKQVMDQVKEALEEGD